MRRAVLTTAITAAAAIWLPAAALAAPTTASVKVVRCSVEDHEAAFYARMQLVAGASRMALRFTLLEETGGKRATRVKVPGLRRWRSSRTGVKAFAYRQNFRNLPENASHRVRVDYRWYAQDGTEVARATRRSARCRQFVELPNLFARITGELPTSVNGVVRYRAVVGNSGKAAAGAVPVRLTVDGNIVDTIMLPSLAPGEQREIVIRGPDCKRLVRLEADPEATITESSEADNAHELSCAALRKTG
jgi:CARDB protein